MKKRPIAGARERARSLRRDMTDAEKSIWRVLRLHQIDGHRFRRQVPLGRYIADFVCHDARLIIEIDGGQHQESAPQEAERTRFLQDQGYRVLRFWNNEVLSNLEGLRATIAETLRCHPLPTLPLEGEGFDNILDYTSRSSSTAANTRSKRKKTPPALWRSRAAAIASSARRARNRPTRIGPWTEVTFPLRHLLGEREGTRRCGDGEGEVGSVDALQSAPHPGLDNIAIT
jgi:very-short-patch-repair endonuclease